MDSANQRLQMLAIEDGMTGLHNHRAFQERLAAEVESAKRYGSELSLIMLDVDNFKQYNDAYGHPEGDLIIKKLAELLKENSRESYSAARYGGEEFALILPQTGVDGASAIAERIRRAVAGTVWQKRYVTISLGIATLTSALDNPRDIIASADEALYRSKHQGRNCVTVADFNEIRQTNSN
jgi:diguanylate cyclase (GGDEF)-like protein